MFLFKNTQIERFRSQIRTFLSFAWNFAFRQIQKSWSHIWKKFFETAAQKHPNKAILVPNLRILIFLYKTLHFEKLYGDRVKYYNSFISNFSLEIPKQGICNANFKDFDRFRWNFAIWSIREYRFHIWR